MLLNDRMILKENSKVESFYDSVLFRFFFFRFFFSGFVFFSLIAVQLRKPRWSSVTGFLEEPVPNPFLRARFDCSLLHDDQFVCARLRS